jgi:hypothetical protein
MNAKLFEIGDGRLNGYNFSVLESGNASFGCFSQCFDRFEKDVQAGVGEEKESPSCVGMLLGRDKTGPCC